jgi:AhpD family alkylhydroperoxidase
MAASFQPSQRRTYRSPTELFRDLWAILRRSPQVSHMMRGRSLDAAFRERLMLAVTQVNNCRYCAYAHTRMALSEGVSAEEIEALGRGSYEGAPEAERPALRYAQHWAASDGRPDPQAAQDLRQRYGDDQAAAIELALRLIRVGNLLGNTWDVVRIGFGSPPTPPER